MMRNISLVWALWALVSLRVSAQEGIKFFEGTWKEALEKAAAEHKMVFVDAYAVWCGPCQRMAKEVFTQKEVGDFYNKHFINVKLDMEKGEGVSFGQKYQVSSYPTLLFIDAKGEMVQVFKGSRPADQFINLGKGVLNSVDKSTDYAEKYESGEREASFLRSYAYQLLTQNKPSLKIANEYLRTQTDLTTEANLEFIFDFCIEADSRLFDLLLQNKAHYAKTQSEEAWKRKIETACMATVRKAVEFQSPDLLKEAKAAMRKALPSYAAEYAMLADMQYYFEKSEYAPLTKATDKYLKKYAWRDAARLNKQAAFFAQYVTDAAALRTAEKWAKQAVTLEEKREYLMTYIFLLQTNGKEAEAKKMQERLGAAPSAPSLPPAINPKKD